MCKGGSGEQGGGSKLEGWAVRLAASDLHAGDLRLGNGFAGTPIRNQMGSFPPGFAMTVFADSRLFYSSPANPCLAEN